MPTVLFMIRVLTVYLETGGVPVFKEKCHDAHTPQRQPEILSCEELPRLFDAAANLRMRTLLMVAYAAGLRVSERKGGKDRYTLLSPSLLRPSVQRFDASRSRRSRRNRLSLSIVHEPGVESPVAPLARRFSPTRFIPCNMQSHSTSACVPRDINPIRYRQDDL